MKRTYGYQHGFNQQQEYDNPSQSQGYGRSAGYGFGGGGATGGAGGGRSRFAPAHGHGYSGAAGGSAISAWGRRPQPMGSGPVFDHPQQAQSQSASGSGQYGEPPQTQNPWGSSFGSASRAGAGYASQTLASSYGSYPGGSAAYGSGYPQNPAQPRPQQDLDPDALLESSPVMQKLMDKLKQKARSEVLAELGSRVGDDRPPVTGTGGYGGGMQPPQQRPGAYGGGGMQHATQRPEPNLHSYGELPQHSQQRAPQPQPSQQPTPLFAGTGGGSQRLGKGDGIMPYDHNKGTFASLQGVWDTSEGTSSDFGQKMVKGVRDSTSSELSLNDFGQKMVKEVRDSSEVCLNDLDRSTAAHSEFGTFEIASVSGPIVSDQNTTSEADLSDRTKFSGFFGSNTAAWADQEMLVPGRASPVSDQGNGGDQGVALGVSDTAPQAVPGSPSAIASGSKPKKKNRTGAAKKKRRKEKEKAREALLRAAQAREEASANDAVDIESTGTEKEKESLGEESSGHSSVRFAGAQSPTDHHAPAKIPRDNVDGNRPLYPTIMDSKTLALKRKRRAEKEKRWQALLRAHMANEESHEQESLGKSSANFATAQSQNDNVLPAKIQTGAEDGNIYAPKSAKEAFNFAITPEGYPTRRLNSDEADEIRTLLCDALLEHIQSNEKGAPIFSETGLHMDGSFRISCGSLASAGWIMGHVDLTLKDGTPLYTRAIPDPSKQPCITVFLPEETRPLENIVKFLDRQNPNLKVHFWTIRDGKEEPGGKRIYAHVPEWVVQTLEEQGWRVFYQLGMVDARLLAQVPKTEPDDF